MADSSSMVFAVNSPMLRVWPHGTLASAGQAGPAAWPLHLGCRRYVRQLLPF
jgi:hypothetical protein